MVNQTGDKQKENICKTGCIDVLANSPNDQLKIVLQSVRRIRVVCTSDIFSCAIRVDCQPHR